MEPIDLPENFSSVMIDFTRDLKTTFPEYAHLWWVYGEETSEDGWKDLYKYCLNVYPERFFDILYQNEEIFKEDCVNNVDFIPRVDFKKLYNCEGVSEKTRNTIWKYLQLILFMVIGNVKDKNEFGSTMNLFDGIDEKELQEKMSEAMGSLGDFFNDFEKNINSDNSDNPNSSDEQNDDSKNENYHENEKAIHEIFEELGKNAFDNMNFDAEQSEEDQSNERGIPQMPNPDDIHSHLKGLFGGKLGSLAEELMEELTDDLQESLGLNPEEFENNSNPADVLKKLMRRPDKLMSLVKKIQNKFQSKMDTGDLSQDDIMKEAGDMLRKMKEMGGNSKQMNEMFQNMAKSMGGSFGKDMKVDTNRLNRMMKSQDIKDRIRSNLERKKQENKFTLETTANENNFVYRPIDGEKAEKTGLSDEQIAKIAEDIGDITSKKVVEAKPKKNKNKKKKNAK